MKNIKHIITAVVLVTVLLFHSGCASNFGGAGIGAGAGAGLGALLSKNKAQGALLGGAIGGGLGYIINDQIKKHREQAAAKAAAENREVKYEVKEINSKTGVATTNIVVAAPVSTNSITGKKMVRTQVLGPDGKVLEEKTMEVGM